MHHPRNFRYFNVDTEEVDFSCGDFKIEQWIEDWVNMVSGGVSDHDIGNN